MALGTVFGQGQSIKFALGATQHETNIAGFREILAETGGLEFTTADGVVHTTPGLRTAVRVEVDMFQDLTAANLWRYLRETTTTTGTIVVTGTSSTTESASNPEWTWTTTGWALPPMEWSPGTIATVTAVFYVSGNPAVDVT